MFAASLERHLFRSRAGARSFRHFSPVRSVQFQKGVLWVVPLAVCLSVCTSVALCCLSWAVLVCVSLAAIDAAATAAGVGGWVGPAFRFPFAPNIYSLSQSNVTHSYEASH